ncbi:hypothetical protein LCGC14_0302720 [marine sediment metagenome]|uniref:Uncharacterized protein n=1 Tax=marine sediment metagenome TaxID=412755 RepID=A0A0F9TPM6_9ZZZZ
MSTVQHNTEMQSKDWAHVTGVFFAVIWAIAILMAINAYYFSDNYYIITTISLILLGLGAYSMHTAEKARDTDKQILLNYFGIAAGAFISLLLIMVYLA